VWLTLLRRSNHGTGLEMGTAIMLLNVLGELGSGGFGTVYLCRALGVSKASAKLEPIGFTVVKVPAVAELHLGVPTVIPSEVSALYPEFWAVAKAAAAVKHQRQPSNVSEFTGLGMWSAVVEYEQESTKQRAVKMAEATAKAAAARAAAEGVKVPQQDAGGSEDASACDTPTPNALCELAGINMLDQEQTHYVTQV
jgi:hypothetical protein